MKNTETAPEFELIECIRAATSKVAASGVVVGIGDDAAIVEPDPGMHLLACTDTLVAAVHFPDATPAQAIGYKAMAVNLSDLAAMGGQPRWATVSLTLPEADPVWVSAFADGLVQAVGPCGVAIIGGDTCTGPLAISVHLLGQLPAGTGMLRSGAQPGDLLAVTGTLGDAALALAIYQEHGRGQVPAPLLLALERPSARVDAGLALRGTASACIDLSDGLLADTGHLANASGVSIVIEMQRLPVSDLFAEHVDQARSAGLVLGGGDDYELCFTFPAADRARISDRLASAGQAWQLIGRVESGSGVTVVDHHDQPLPIAKTGYQHFHE